MLLRCMTFLVNSSVYFGSRFQVRHSWAVAKRLRHRVLIPAFGSSNLPGPAIFSSPTGRKVSHCRTARLSPSLPDDILCMSAD